MSKYTISDIREADRLWDEMPLPDVATALDIPLPTLRDWARRGWIETETVHQGCRKAHSDQKIELADELWDVYPLSQVSDLLDVPEGTLCGWADKGWISTETDHYRDPEMAEKVQQAAEIVYIEGNTQREAAERMEVAESTISRYLKRYRNGTYA